MCRSVTPPTLEGVVEAFVRMLAVAVAGVVAGRARPDWIMARPTSMPLTRNMAIVRV